MWHICVSSPLHPASGSQECQSSCDCHTLINFFYRSLVFHGFPPSPFGDISANSATMSSSFIHREIPWSCNWGTHKGARSNRLKTFRLRPTLKGAGTLTTQPQKHPLTSSTILFSEDSNQIWVCPESLYFNTNVYWLQYFWLQDTLSLKHVCTRTCAHAHTHTLRPKNNNLVALLKMTMIITL